MSVLLARYSLLDFWNKVSNFEANMVLYYAILRFWIHLGQSEFAVRSLSVVFALAAVTALYWLGTRTFGRKIGILGALLLAINGFHIEYSQDARSYSLLVFLECSFKPTAGRRDLILPGLLSAEIHVLPRKRAKGGIRGLGRPACLARCLLRRFRR
jgi:hypothetical protein